MAILDNYSVESSVKKMFSLMCMSFIIFGSLGGCSKEEEPVVKEVVRPAILMTIEQKPIVKEMEFPGKVQALDRVELSFEVSGKLVSLPVKEGQHVKKGDIIAQIDPTNYKSQLNAAQARVNQSKAELDRYENLLREKVVAKSTYDIMKRNYEVSLADLAIAQKAYNDTSLKASFAGMIGKKFVENYQVIQEKQPIVSLQRITAVEIVVNAPENVMTRPAEDSSLSFEAEFANYPGELIEAFVKEYATEADPQTQTFRVVFSITPPSRMTIFDGMTATVYGYLKTAKGISIEVPVQSVFFDETGQAFVWKTDSDMRLVRHKVSVGMVTNGNIIIESGLSNGDRVVVSGVQKLKDGMKVREFTGVVGE